MIAFYQLSASFLVCAVLIGQMSGNEMQMRQASNQIQLGHQDQFGYVTYSPLEMGLKREAVFPDQKEFYGTSMPMDINPTEAYPYWDESRTDNYPQDFYYINSRPALATAVNMMKRGRHRYNCRQLMRAETGFGGIC